MMEILKATVRLNNKGRETVTIKSTEFLFCKRVKSIIEIGFPCDNYNVPTIYYYDDEDKCTDDYLELIKLHLRLIECARDSKKEQSTTR